MEYAHRSSQSHSSISKRLDRNARCGRILTSSYCSSEQRLSSHHYSHWSWSPDRSDNGGWGHTLTSCSRHGTRRGGQDTIEQGCTARTQGQGRMASDTLGCSIRASGNGRVSVFEGSRLYFRG